MCGITQRYPGAATAGRAIRSADDAVDMHHQQDMTHPPVPIDDLVAGIRATLGEDLVGLYLYGSYLLGDFDPHASDLDLVAVLSRDVYDAHVARLGRLHDAFVRTHATWDNRLDIVYIGRDTLSGFRDGKGTFAVISPGESFHLQSGVGDWRQTWYLLRETSIPLVGPNARELVPPILRSEFVAAVLDDLPHLRAWSASHGAGAVAYGVLTVCRALQTVRTDAMPSKPAAAAWVRQQMPEWAWLIDAALACRHSGGQVGFDDAATRDAARRFIDMLADQITQAPPSTGAPGRRRPWS